MTNPTSLVAVIIVAFPNRVIIQLYYSEAMGEAVVGTGNSTACTVTTG
jgi:hypothetical protein